LKRQKFETLAAECRGRGPRALDKHVDLCYSEDDGGWYFQRYPQQDCSPLYSTVGEAYTAFCSIGDVAFT
jgi:hypothetical protein